jgi:FAS-associated factor 2
MNFLYAIVDWILNFLKNLFDIKSKILPGKSDEMYFAEKFEEKYGTKHPIFKDAKFSEVILEAKNSFKIICVYLHSEEHIYTEETCKNIISTETFTNYMNDKFIFYGNDISTKSGLLLSNNIRATSYPYFGFLIANPELRLIRKIEGEKFNDLEEFLDRLYKIYEDISPHLLVERDERINRTQSRSFREEQDLAFQRSLEMDQMKEEEEERKKKEEEENKKKEELKKIEIKNKKEEIKIERENIREEFSKKIIKNEKDKNLVPNLF